MQIAIGIVLIIAAVFLVVAVLMQSGKSHNLSGTIAGGAETFFGKSKASTMDKKLSKLTTIVAIVFTVLVLVSYLTQDIGSTSKVVSQSTTAGTSEITADTTAEETEASDTADTTADTTADEVTE
ncbi:MAG: preprotein translocase subunit SecG [Eubacteriales bacterium]